MMSEEFMPRWNAVLEMRGIPPDRLNGFVHKRAFEMLGKGRTQAEVERSLLFLETNLDRKDMIGSFRAALGGRKGGKAEECLRCGTARYLYAIRHKALESGGSELWPVAAACGCLGRSQLERVVRAGS
jgi:hypothetical protein